MATDSTIQTEEKAISPRGQRGELRSRDESGGLASRRPIRAARGLGWFSIGLGAAELVAPRRIARLVGVRDTGATCMLVRALGAREVLSGLGLLRTERPTGWLWARVAGDAMDLALLGSAMGSRRASHERLGAATAAVAGVAILDVLAARTVGRERRIPARGIEVKRQVTINRSPEEVYEFWRSLDNLPRFMAHLDSVEVLAPRHSRWTARGPAGMKVEWEADIVADQPGERIEWRSREGADVANEGEVTFRPAPGGRGTEVRVTLRYDAPAGTVGVLVARLFGKEPGQQVEGDLRRLKQVLETGEVVHSDASIHRGPHPGRPPAVLPAAVTDKGGE